MSTTTPPPMPRKARYSGCQSVGVVLTCIILFWFLISLTGLLMSWKITILVGLAIIALSGWLAQREHSWLRKAQVVPGTVVELIAVSGSKGGTNYKPRVRYTTTDGAVRDFVRGYSSSPAGVEVGESLAVAYDPAAGDARILTFGQRYGFAACLAVIGVSVVLLAAVFLAGRQYVPRIYLPGGNPLSDTNRGW